MDPLLRYCVIAVLTSVIIKDEVFGLAMGKKCVALHTDVLQIIRVALWCHSVYRHRYANRYLWYNLLVHENSPYVHVYSRAIRSVMCIYPSSQATLVAAWQ